MLIIIGLIMSLTYVSIVNSEEHKSVGGSN